MSKFKDAVQKDIRRVFLNTEEFAEIHMVDGKEMPVIIDENEASDREIKYAGYGAGVYKIHKLIYVPQADFGSLPAQGRTLSLDGKQYRVIDAVSESGIYSITLEVVQSGGSTGRRQA